MFLLLPTLATLLTAFPPFHHSTTRPLHQPATSIESTLRFSMSNSAASKGVFSPSPEFVAAIMQIWHRLRHPYNWYQVWRFKRRYWAAERGRTPRSESEQPNRQILSEEDDSQLAEGSQNLRWLERQKDEDGSDEPEPEQEDSEEDQTPLIQKKTQ
ncbi:hypothetical protein EDC01DRAFT_747581 [Geopyxis carbonaria]|nr:hypothetical protein EDC01DRAFT_747581 [Geopyxis carbonaria]